jgi:hypothetical protein
MPDETQKIADDIAERLRSYMADAAKHVIPDGTLPADVMQDVRSKYKTTVNEKDEITVEAKIKIRIHRKRK